MSDKTFTARTDDEGLITHLESSDRSNNEWIIEAMREKRQRETDMNDTLQELTEDQRTAYRWLCDRLDHGGHINLESVKNTMAKQAGVDMQLVEDQIIRPLDNKGYLTVVPRISDVVIKVNTEKGR